MASKASIKRLKFCNFKLDSLLETTNAINNNLSIDELLAKFKMLLIEQLNIAKLAIFAKRSSWEIMLYGGVGKAIPEKISVVNDLLGIVEITTVSSTKTETLEPFDFIIPVYHKDTPLAYVLIGDVDEEKEGVSPTIKHLHFIKTLTNVIFVAIENKRLYIESLKQERLNRDMELAAGMQKMLIPDTQEFEKNQAFDIQAFYLPHFAIGGDYYDFGKLSENSYFFCIADVSGKGISAALLMSNFQAGLRSVLSEKTELTELVENLNTLVLKNAGGEKFITFFIATYNTQTRTLEYVNAGHNPPLLHSGDKLTELKDGCPGVGMLDTLPPIRKGFHQKLAINTRLICFTDGIAELENKQGEEIGTLKLKNSLRETNTIDDTFKYLKQNLNLKKGNNKLFDDITMLGINFK